MTSQRATENELARRVYSIISKTLGIAEDTINAGDEIEQLANDSIQLFELILAFEQEFSTQVRYEDLVNIKTVEDIISFVGSHPEYVPQEAGSTTSGQGRD